jgi:glucose-specific phosphotransferase system IIA component
MMGEGLAIYPAAGRIVSPVDGVIKAANLQMQHAIGLETQEGIELLIHVGLDTVSLANEGFELLVSEGQKVKAGELLLRFDRKVISSAGLDDVVMLIVTNPKDYQFDFQTGIEVVDGEEIGTWK